ncbi:hypothetical protein I306_05901 [Cryptococcus gattii EJB2]|uniref:Uncharacterized protein n=1 Tax=Cryptococcus gattii EJB2 TaxID=1296103 RepID=A0ABR5BN87_9TREE|nr:hypothetical protein I306_05901 [Cryptococcus gattii EJB2]
MALSRPLPPHRRRISLVTQRAPASLIEDDACDCLRDKSDDQLRAITADDLVQVLRGQWNLNDKMTEKIEVLENNRDKLEINIGELSRAMATLQSRFDETLNEQSRMEADLIERNELLDRLSMRMSETEKQVKDAQKRCVDQEVSFEAERRAFQAQEEHLRERINSLLSTSRKTATVPAIAEQRCDAYTISSLKDEIASLKLSSTTLRAKNSTLTQDIHELKNVNNALQEDNDAWEFLLRERTFNGDIKREGDGSLDANQLQNRYEGHEPEPLDEALILESPSSRRNKKTSDDTYSPLVGVDLASELGIFQEEGEPGYLKEDTDIEGMNECGSIETIFILQIIDRIIAQDGFEHVLSVDYKSRQAGSHNVSATQTPLKDIPTTLAQPSNAEMTSKPPATSQVSASSKDKIGRPLSMMIAKAFSGVAEKTPVVEDVPLPSSPFPTPVETPRLTVEKQEKRAHRGFSLDFHSFGFGGIAIPESPKPELKPLNLASRATNTTSPLVKKEKGAITGCKLAPTEEDEEDRRERHRMEATLKLMGVFKPADTSNGQDIMTKSPDSRKSPWGLLCSTVGSTEPTSPFGNTNPDAAQAALNEHDQQEAVRMKSLAQGKSEAGYTIPPRMGMPRRQSSGRERLMSVGSVNTLWSMGSSSRPTSMDVTRDGK